MRIIIPIILAFILIHSVHSSSIKSIPLEEMESLSELVVLGKISNIEKDKNRDKVSLDIRTVLKGAIPKSGQCSFWLTSRGGLKDFDPELKLGESVVAFLKISNGTCKKAYFGSIAVFTKPNYL